MGKLFNMDQLRLELEEANAKFIEIVKRGDAQAASAVYSENAILIPPNTEIIRGRESIEKFWRGGMKEGLANMKLTIISVGGDNNICYEIGRCTVISEKKGEEPQEEIMRYMVVRQKSSEGTWKVLADIWN